MKKDNCSLCGAEKFVGSKVCGECRWKIQRREIPCPPEFLPKSADLGALDVIIAKGM